MSRPDALARLADGELRRLVIAAGCQPVFPAAGAEQLVSQQQVLPAARGVTTFVSGPPAISSPERTALTNTPCSGGGRATTGICAPVPACCTLAFPAAGRPNSK